MKLKPSQRRLAKANNIKIDVVHNRLKTGWTVEDAITKPVRTERRMRGLNSGGKYVTEEQLRTAAEHGISKNAVRIRLWKHDMSVHDAITKPTEEFHKNRTDKRKYTDAEIATLKRNGIPMNVFYQRMWKGWDKERALTHPVIRRSKNREKPTVDDEWQEVIESIGRIKYLNKTDFRDNPITYPKPMLKKLAAKGMTISEVEEIEV